MVNQVIKSVSLGSIFLAVLGCSAVQPRQRPSQNLATVRDVPYQARTNPQAPIRKRVIVLPFIDSKAKRSKTVTTAARHAVVREMLRSGQFVIIQNTDLPKDPEEYLTQDREYDLEKVSQVAEGMGVSGVIEGKVLSIKARRLGDQVGVFRKLRARVDAEVRLRVVTTENGKVVLNDKRSATVEAQTTRVGKYASSDSTLSQDPALVRKSVQKAFRQVLPQIFRSMEKMDWQGKIALVNGERIFINAGRLSGLQIGDILKVKEEGEEIYDPETGVYIGQAPGRTKGTVEIIRYFGKDGAIGVVHSGSGFKENDQVELY